MKYGYKLEKKKGLSSLGEPGETQQAQRDNYSGWKVKTPTVWKPLILSVSFAFLSLLLLFTNIFWPAPRALFFFFFYSHRVLLIMMQPTFWDPNEMSLCSHLVPLQNETTGYLFLTVRGKCQKNVMWSGKDFV